MTYEEYLAARVPHLRRLALLITRDPDVADDVLQDVLVKLHLHWARVARTDDPDAYVRRMLVNQTISWRRRWHTRNVRVATDAQLQVLAPEVPDHAERSAEYRAALDWLAVLAPRQRAAVVLRYFEGLSDEEIAVVMDVREVTVRTTISHALAVLRAGAQGPPSSPTPPTRLASRPVARQETLR